MNAQRRVGQKPRRIILISFFEKVTVDSDISFVVLKLSRKKTHEFKLQLPLKFRRCYIADSTLEEQLRDPELTRTELFDAYLPDKGSIMAGEFGEILSYHLLKSIYLPIQLSGPLKWRFKPDAKRAVQYTDVVLYHLADPNAPSIDDLLIAAESKVKSTKTDKHPIQDAIDGSADDRTHRLAVTLAWLRRRAIKTNNQVRRKIYDRFIKISAYGSYNRHFKAIALVDHDLLDQELSKGIDTAQCFEKTEILVVSIPDLQKLYECVYSDIISTGNTTAS
jgi:hypothetical protein